MEHYKNKDCSQISEGGGSNDYANYMQTGTLLSLQQPYEKLQHRDEILFQIVHQSTELWLKLNCHELTEALHLLKSKKFADVTALMQRASCGIELITQQLDMLKFMTPWDFQGVRPALGNGSGLESPGWRNLQSLGENINNELEQMIRDDKIDLVNLYKSQINSTLFNLVETLVEWDEKVSLWRTRHYKVAVRTIGLNTVGTKGKPIEKLTRLINQEFFPVLWKVRTQLTNADMPY